MSAALPPEILVGATVLDDEYGWKLSEFPVALAIAEKHELACLEDSSNFEWTI